MKKNFDVFWGSFGGEKAIFEKKIMVGSFKSTDFKVQIIAEKIILQSSGTEFTSADLNSLL